MLVIRLQRVGKKNQPSYRIVLTEKTAPVKGRFIEILGNYNPVLKTKSIKKDRILYWLSQGVKTSATIHNLLVTEKIIEGPKVKAWTPKKKEQAEGEVETKTEAEVEVKETTQVSESVGEGETKEKKEAPDEPVEKKPAEQKPAEEKLTEDKPLESTEDKRG